MHLRDCATYRNIIRKYLRARELLQPNPRPKRKSKLDSFLGGPQQWMDKDIYNCEVLLDQLQAEGCKGGPPIPQDCVQQFCPPRCPRWVKSRPALTKERGILT